jgi:hypothetical protein
LSERGGRSRNHDRNANHFRFHRTFLLAVILIEKTRLAER